MDTKQQPKLRAAHCLPFPGSVSGTYLYSDGCTVRKHGDGSYSLIAYDSTPIPAHTYADFATHPDDTDANP